MYLQKSSYKSSDDEETDVRQHTSQKDFTKQILDQNSALYLETFYKKQKIDNYLLKKTFENYMNSIDFTFKNTDNSIQCGQHQNQMHFYPQSDVLKTHQHLKIKKLKTNCYRFFKILDQVWQCEDVEFIDIKNLHQCQLVTLFSIIKKKFQYNLDLSSLHTIHEDLNSLKNLQNQKRVEEINKFVVKKYLKYQTQNLQQNLHQQFKDKLLNNLTLTQYSKIFDVNNQHQIVIKKVNNKNISILMDQAEFYESIKKYCSQILIQEQKKQITNKLFVITVRLQTERDKIKTLEKFKEYQQNIEQDPKTKYPWTIKEVQNAIEDFFSNKFVPKKISQRDSQL